LNGNYETWDRNTDSKELLFLAVAEDVNEVLAVIGLCDFDDLEEYRHLKPWLCAFVVREDLRGSGIGSQVLELMEARARDYGIELVYLWTEDQLEFYLKRGYEKFDELLKAKRTLHIMKKTI
jgi:N-acetylglutamate synthase-like GNAT family acetyltransferase